ncbi:MAG: Ig-like domain-containing protein [Treponema sp.]|nr:Ig-like domain-containing protein [Treponema sp.]
MKSTTIQNHGWGGVFLAATLTATLLALFSGCKNPTSSSWEEPVRDYFEKYTNTAAIEKHEINAESIKDKNDTSCVSSDGAKTITFYLRNPREYTLITDFPPTYDGTGVTIEQDRQDKTIIRVTYPQAYLQENEGGGQIGGTIRLTEDETLREFDSYSFSLKCNTPPPAVTRQCVNASNSTNTYWVCFWLPTAELANPIHADVKTLYIKGVTQKSVAITNLATENDGNPGDLRALDDTAAFTAPTSGEYTAFYYNTGRGVHDGENIQWNIYLEDNDGLKSKTMTASTKTTPVHMTINGGDLLTTNEGDNTLNLTASVDSPVTSWSWSSNNTAVATVPDGANDSTVTVTAVDGDGGEATITATAYLADGRTVSKTKRIRVLDLYLDTSEPDFVKGQTGAYINAIKPDFATVSWTSENSAVATISEGGALNAVAKGSATIVATASYGGKTVSKQMTVYVHELTVSGGNDVTELFVGGATATFTVTSDSPDGRTLPGITYTWTPTGSAASITEIGNSVTASPVSAGTTTLTCTTNLYGMTITLATKTIKVYGLPSIEVGQPSSYNNGNSDSDSNLYALTDLGSSLTFKVADASTAYPSGTKFNWTINGVSLTAESQKVSPISISLSALGINTISTNKSSPTSIAAKCKVELPSGKKSQEVSGSVSVYKLTIPSITVDIEEFPTDLKSSGKYFVGKYDSNKKFKFKATASNIPNGVTYTWKVGTRTIATGTDKQTINPTISQLRNSTTPPTGDETCTVKCTVSLTGCTSQEGSTSVTFAKRTPLNAPTPINVYAAIRPGRSGTLESQNGNTFTFSSDTNIEDIQIFYSWNQITGVPEGKEVSYGVYFNESFETSCPGIDNTDHYCYGDSLPGWNTPCTISVQACLTPADPEWDYSDKVDLGTITIKKATP